MRRLVQRVSSASGRIRSALARRASALPVSWGPSCFQGNLSKRTPISTGWWLNSCSWNRPKLSSFLDWTKLTDLGGTASLSIPSRLAQVPHRPGGRFPQNELDGSYALWKVSHNSASLRPDCPAHFWIGVSWSEELLRRSKQRKLMLLSIWLSQKSDPMVERKRRMCLLWIAVAIIGSSLPSDAVGTSLFDCCAIETSQDFAQRRSGASLVSHWLVHAVFWVPQAVYQVFSCGDGFCGCQSKLRIWQLVGDSNQPGRAQ